ncbi:hypothetical protein QTP81_15470 [Alteromonas sp. ASW11-36]|uniref:Orphan protein n=1 Tax=Alteromonas arenosi TaxID=3055817 RepID=A0ABT7T0N6_9ALTE|nr:DUF6702 family protein [Alteromonas sp. ASW11-36]MDM7862002.1 hypothetical protein [Alteromonas sp. ASW11-36]
MLVVLALIAIPPMGVSAHQQKAAISTVLFNERTGNIELMHRFILHDAEHAAKRLLPEAGDIHTDADTQQAFVTYVLSRFAIGDLEQRQLQLTTVGFEIDGKHLWVYQETPIPESLTGLTLIHAAMQEIWPKQTNTVNIEGRGPLRTLTFNAGDGAKSIRFD